MGLDGRRTRADADRIGHEVEEIIPVGPVSGPPTVGKVTEIEGLTEFKKPFRAVKVDVGESELRDIVCGATNLPSTTSCCRPSGHRAAGRLAIATRKTYGRTSRRHDCSATELILGTDIPASWYYRRAAVPGTPAADVFGLDDVVFHLAITPDRGYGLSVRGMARESPTPTASIRRPADVAPLPVDGERCR